MDEIRKRMRQITRMAQTYTAKAQQGVGLSPSQLHALRIINFHDGISQQGLAAHIGIDKAAIARITTVLEAKGYITRSPDLEDGRVKRLAAAAPGQELVRSLISGETDFYEHIFKGVSHGDIDAFKRVLHTAFEEAAALRNAGFDIKALKGDAQHAPDN